MTYVPQDLLVMTESPVSTGFHAAVHDSVFLLLITGCFLMHLYNNEL